MDGWSNTLPSRPLENFKGFFYNATKRQFAFDILRDIGGYKAIITSFSCEPIPRLNWQVT